MIHHDELLTLYLGDCLEVMAGMEAESVDAIVTDPPYNLSFMGKEWDRKHEHEPWAREAFRVARPGAHLLAFGGTRTYHRLAAAIEDAGWEIRDCLVWAYASGFPKSHNLGNGWGTALKPAWEPIVMARKPLRGTVAANVQEHGTGALNIDGTRIPWRDDLDLAAAAAAAAGYADSLRRGTVVQSASIGRESRDGTEPGGVHPLGRWPANLILTDPVLGDEFSRFFIVPKAARADREPLERGLLAERSSADITGRVEGSAGLNHPRASVTGSARQNAHPTVKPLELMRHLVRLVTPPGGTVLDCFLGSGTTAIAANQEGFRAIGIELDPDYMEIALARLVHQRIGMAL